MKGVPEKAEAVGSNEPFRPVNVRKRSRKELSHPGAT